MKLQPISLAIGAALLIAGCANVAQPTTVKAVSVEAVMRQVKKELAQYTAYQQARAAEKRASTVCKGNVDFAIDSVSISLVTQTDISVDGNASFSIPVAGAGTVGPSLAGSYGNTQTQTVNFTIFPVDGSQPPEATTKSDSLFDGTPIADSLKAFRESLVKASDQPPCVTFSRVGDGGKQDNSIVYNFKVVQSVKGGATYKFLIFSAGLTTSLQQQNTNVITAKFKETGGTAINTTEPGQTVAPDPDARGGPRP